MVRVDAAFSRKTTVAFFSLFLNQDGKKIFEEKPSMQEFTH